MSTSKDVILVSSDGDIFTVDEAVAVKSELIKNMIEVNCANEVIGLDFTSEILHMVFEYCKKHVEAAADDDLKSWDDEFLNVDIPVFFELLLAANFMSIESLVDLIRLRFINMVKWKSLTEIGNLFNLPPHLIESTMYKMPVVLEPPREDKRIVFDSPGSTSPSSRQICRPRFANPAELRALEEYRRAREICRRFGLDYPQESLELYSRPGDYLFPPGDGVNQRSYAPDVAEHEKAFEGLIAALEKFAARDN